MTTLNLSKALSSGGLKVNSTPAKTISASNIKTGTATPVNISKAIASGGLTVNSTPKTTSGLTTSNISKSGGSSSSKSSTKTNAVSNQMAPGALDQATNMPSAQGSIDSTGTALVPTVRPSPTNVKVATPSTPSTLPSPEPAPAPTPSATKTGFDTVKASNIEAPTTKGEADSIINKTVKKTTPEVSIVGGIMDTDKNFDSILTSYDDFFSPVKQRQSLLEEYKSMEKSLGISAMNEELINTKRIIDGTEDDIRSEVQAVSGFATDSQVLALAGARNKSLIKNYNYLLESRDSAMTQLNTMMNLSTQDRQLASAEFDRKLNFAFKVQEFKDKAVNNAREGYNNVVKAMGYDGLYKSLVNSGDPSAIATVEKTLGLASGQLKTLASQSVKSSAEKLQFISGTANQPAGTFNPATGVFTPLTAGGSASGGKLQLAQTEQSINDVTSLVNNPYIRSAVGPTWLGRFVGRGLDTATGERQNYIASVEKLRSGLTLDSLINAKARGATFGALSDSEMQVLSSSASKLGSWAIKDSSGNVTGYSASEKDFKKELNTINNFAKLDYILKGGDPNSVGVQVVNGDYIVQNEDGTYTQLQ